jgi:hypothetical protein
MASECTVNEVKNKQVISSHHITGFPIESDMHINTTTISLKLTQQDSSKAVLLKNLILSCDPYMRGAKAESKGRLFYSFNPGKPIIGYGVAKVVDSRHPNFRVDDLVWGTTSWEEYSLITDEQQLESLYKIEHTDVPLSYYTGLLGMPGMTAFAGLTEICTPKKGEYVFISSAFGAIGQLVGQFAKLMGCYVVGSAGSQDKIEALKNKLGFNEAFNYKEEKDLDATLKRYFPQGIDIFFDNVGGEILDAVLANMRSLGRIAVCGMISQYEVEKPYAITNITNILFKKIKMQGFTVYDYYHLFPTYYNFVLPHIRQGKIVYAEDVSEGLESGPNALQRLFNGKNSGKQIIIIAKD